MFVSFEHKIVFGKKDYNCSYKYELVDSEFGTVSGGVVVVPGIDIWIVIIQEYSQRNLNVAANLAVAFVWHSKLYPYFSIQDIINYNRQFNPLFLQYEEDLQKYLLLL